MAGAIMGNVTHSFTPFAYQGKSLHPLQRTGSVPVGSMPSIGAAGNGAGLGMASRGAAPLNLGLPPVQAAGQFTINASRDGRNHL